MFSFIQAQIFFTDKINVEYNLIHNTHNQRLRPLDWIRILIDMKIQWIPFQIKKSNKMLNITMIF